LQSISALQGTEPLVVLLVFETDVCIWVLTIMPATSIAPRLSLYNVYHGDAGVRGDDADAHRSRLIKDRNADLFRACSGCVRLVLRVAPLHGASFVVSTVVRTSSRVKVIGGEICESVALLLIE
jgi:hypothetical protein